MKKEKVVAGQLPRRRTQVCSTASLPVLHRPLLPRRTSKHCLLASLARPPAPTPGTAPVLF